VPLAANLANGELAINITDGKLFYKDNAAAVQVIGWKTVPTSAGGTGLTSYTAGDTLYYASGTTLTKLAIGTAYQAFQVNAGATAPSWQPSASSVLTAQGDLLYASGANTLARLAKDATSTRYLSNTGSSNNPAWAQVDITNGVTGTLPATSGGTGQNTVTTGDLLYGSATNTWSKLADVATGNALISGGISTAPSWGKIGLTTHVSGILPVANGGTNASSASITAFNNITGYSASGATGTTTTNLVFSTSPTLTTPTLGAALATSIKFGSGAVLSSYEEGTWTPTDLSGAGLSFTTALGRYTKVGNQVTAWAWIQYPVTASAADNTIGGLPFTIANQTAIRGGFALGFSQTASVGGGILSPNTAYFVLVTSAGVNVTNATLSTLIVSFAVIYHVA
jgi:hypothetical protein